MLAYRSRCNPAGLVTFPVRFGESDILISAGRDLSELALARLRVYRYQLEAYIARDERFLASLVPVEVLLDAPPIVKEMARASADAGVGPMAAVAGAVAEHLAQDLLSVSTEVIVENGGDIYLKRKPPCTIGIFAGPSPLSMRVGLAVEPQYGLGIATSSGTVGHSLSFGRADACVVLSRNAALADAAATALANKVQSSLDAQPVAESARRLPGIMGVVIIIGNTLAAWGRGFSLKALDEPSRTLTTATTSPYYTEA